MFTMSQANLQRLGAQVCGLFVEVEQEDFSRRLDDLLPLLEKEMNPDNYEDVQNIHTHLCHLSLKPEPKNSVNSGLSCRSRRSRRRREQTGCCSVF